MKRNSLENKLKLLIPLIILYLIVGQFISFKIDRTHNMQITGRWVECSATEYELMCTNNSKDCLKVCLGGYYDSAPIGNRNYLYPYLSHLTIPLFLLMLLL